MHCGKLMFFCHDLLRCHFTVGGEEMKEQRTDVGCIAASGRVEHGSEIRWVDDLNDLSDESLLSRMTDLECVIYLFPNVFCSVNLLTSGSCGGHERSWIYWSHEKNIVRKTAVDGIRE